MVWGNESNGQKNHNCIAIIENSILKKCSNQNDSHI